MSWRRQHPFRRRRPPFAAGQGPHYAGKVACSEIGVHFGNLAPQLLGIPLAQAAYHEKPDKALLSEKKKQRDADKESLRFDSIAEAQSKSDALGKTVSEMKKAYDNAQSALSDSDKKIAGYNASITELSKQLSSDCDLDKEAETKKKAELSEKRTADDNAAKALHTHIESNTKVLANIQAKVGDLDALEKRYTWLKALSNTANGNISGKEKVMLETYIQMTYFDRIIARANTRFMVMSGVWAAVS